jgi:hypothetical protein
MKNIISIIISMLIGISAIYAQDWQTNFEKAKAMASKESKPIILVF